jgi:O-antigen/teichoic acid export membrane protein
MFLARFISIVAYLLCCLYTIPILRKFYMWKLAIIPYLFSYAGWVAISNVIVPVLVQIDRYLIAALITVEAVTFYSVPFEVLNGLWIIPGAITATLFPAFSSLQTKDVNNLFDLYVRPIKYILITLGPIVLLITIFSYNILLIWQGSIFAENSKLVLQILVIGVLINSLGWVPGQLIMGFGRPDLTAKIHILQLPLYLGLAALLISNFGIIGAAIAFTVRVTFEAILVFGASLSITPATRRALRNPELLEAIILLAVLALCLFSIQIMASDILIRVGICSVILILYVLITYIKILDNADKKLIRSLLHILKKVGREN